MSEQNSDIDKLVPESETVTLNGHELEIRPQQNDKILESAMQSEKQGDQNTEFFLQLAASCINENEGFDDVTASDLRNSRGNILPIVMAVQKVHGLSDFLDEEDMEEIA